MGVKGLWYILESVRRKVDFEQLRGKRIAIDMNIWLHQALKSNAKGNRNVHFAILFRRICKLLFYGIRPVFVFDGAVPALKKNTMANRRAYRSTAQERSLRARNILLKRLFRRLAENAVSPKKPNGELTAEFLNRYNTTEAIRRAEIDEEIFGSQNSILEAPLPSSSILHLESEQETALELAKDFVASSSSIDIYSDAFDALPIRAQLQVILILQDTSVDTSPQVHGETFSQAQIKRLMMRRELSRKKEEIESRMNESLIAEAVPKEMQSTSDMDVRAFRIASQDEGHAILLKRRSSKEKADDLRARLNRILVGSPGTDLNSDEKATSEPNTAAELPKTDPDSTSHNGIFENDEIEVKEEVPESEASSTDTDDFVDVKAGSEDIKTLDNLALRLIQSIEAGAASATNKNQVIIAKQPAKAGDVEFIKSDEESSLEQSSSEGIHFADVTEQSVSTEHSNDFGNCIDQSTSSENSQNHLNNVQPSPVKNVIKEELSAKKADGEMTFVGKVPKSEVKDEFNRDGSFPQIPSFLASGFDEIDDNLEIDDSVLRSEAERFERLAQETTSDYVAEAQRLVELFGFPVVTSPEEAEAQCCRLQQLGLVDVVASDDSDVWVFGASLVCRHLFGNDSGKSKSKPTSLYSNQDIKKCLGLDRRHLIQLAMLCGSDYTNGIDKVGPIKAVEIVAFFCRSYNYPNSTELDAVLQPLLEFREFCLRGTDSRWKNIKVPDGNMLFNRNQFNLLLLDFPNEMVVKGYLSPKVEEPNGFQWDTPQMALLTKYPFQ
nr:DNA repair protein complementing XP G cells [Hymenolepis microstoma]